MISILLMTVFSGTDPMMFKPGKTTTDFARIGPMDALASVSNKIGNVHTRAEKAQTYIDALRAAKNADAIKNETVKDDKNGEFTIANFKIDENHALLKFWKVLETGAKTVLTCVIDRASVGLKETANVTANMMKASWLNYFWKLWSGKDETFTAAKFTLNTQNAINKLAQDAANNGTAFSYIKGLTPRYDKGLSENEVEQARIQEMNSLIPTLLRMNRMGINMPEIVTKFSTKIWGLLGTPGTSEKMKKPGPLDLAKPGTLEAFANDDEPSQLQLDFWKVFWQNTMVKIVSNGLDQKAADDLTEKSLAAIDIIAKIYENKLNTQ